MKCLKFLLQCLLSLTILISCSKDDTQTEIMDEDPDPAVTDTSIKYKVTFVPSWNKTNHPNEFPSGAHFSGIVGMTHSINAKLFEEGNKASKGIETMAETGGQSDLKNEINELIDQKMGLSVISASGISYNEQASDEFTANLDFHYVTITSMIAPSPDWFIAVQNVNLRDGDSWKENFEIDVKPYDAGTEEGTKFTFSNSATSPQENITEIKSGILVSDNKIASMGKMKFEMIN